MNIQIGVAGLPEELELRLSLACGLLAASHIHVDVQEWKGRESDILIVDLDSGYGRLAHEIATRRKLPVLVFARSDGAEHASESRLDRQAPAAVLARTLQERLLPASTTSPDSFQGLLGICLREVECGQDLLVRRSGIALVLRHVASRIHARSVSDLHAAEARLLDNTWLCSTKPAMDTHEHEWLVSRSLDSFLVNACLRHESSLPTLGGNMYRLTRWPDLGNVTDDLDSLRLSSLLYRSGRPVEALKQHTNVSAKRINAFLWATLASGALVCDDGNIATTLTQSHPSPATASVIQRVARHFGLKLGYSHV
ncbi:hypothetical protein [Rhodanobacter sp. A1T4]|uniref:hypothetical protein n=1 Tax=Rhodanobacter sp. A1T4 TaxID=2723087 RepID=UPI0016158F1B|nr:hypothetical protein [Rhodanobacter sp. A1T4]MBB6248379.1 hypothetical protein [Rhodanobacter sp. A1T4]